MRVAPAPGAENLERGSLVEIGPLPERTHEDRIVRHHAGRVPGDRWQISLGPKNHEIGRGQLDGDARQLGDELLVPVRDKRIDFRQVDDVMISQNQPIAGHNRATADRQRQHQPEVLFLHPHLERDFDRGWHHAIANVTIDLRGHETGRRGHDDGQ